MDTDKRESLITRYCIAEKKPSRSAQQKITISETLVLMKIGERVVRIMNTSYFLTTQRNRVLLTSLVRPSNQGIFSTVSSTFITKFPILAPDF